MAIRSSPGRSYRVPASSLINLSHGARRQSGGHQRQRESNSVQNHNPASNQGKGQKQQQQAPDATKLPNPTALFKKKENGAKIPRQKNKNPSEKKKQPADNGEFNDLWKTMMAGGEQPVVPDPQPSQDGLSQDLKNMLNIDGRREENSVMQFFQAASAVQHDMTGLPSLPPTGNQPQFCRTLVQLLESRRLAPPRYRFIPGPQDNFMTVELTLPCGRTFSEYGLAVNEPMMAEQCAKSALAFIESIDEQFSHNQTGSIAGRGLGRFETSSSTKFVPMQVNKRKAAAKPSNHAQSNNKDVGQNVKRDQDLGNMEGQSAQSKDPRQRNVSSGNGTSRASKNKGLDNSGGRGKGEGKASSRRGRIAANFSRQ